MEKVSRLSVLRSFIGIYVVLSEARGMRDVLYACMESCCCTLGSSFRGPAEQKLQLCRSAGSILEGKGHPGKPFYDQLRETHSIVYLICNII